MKIYVYDKKTGEFLYEKEAQPNPKRIGEYIFPLNSTQISPPEVSDYQARIFNGSNWEIVSDFRNCDVINVVTKATDKIRSLGPLPQECMLYSDYLNSELYQKDLEESLLEERRNNILQQMYILDEKRVRAMCEPEIKDEQTGETWLDYYNAQIVELRQELAELI